MTLKVRVRFSYLVEKKLKGGTDTKFMQIYPTFYGEDIGDIIKQCSSMSKELTKMQGTEVSYEFT